MTKPGTTQDSPTPKQIRLMRGTVLRRSGDKTVAVEVTRVVVHPLYHKRQTRRKTYLAHDPANQAKVGDQVTLRQTRPLSRRKRWIIVQ